MKRRFLKKGMAFTGMTVLLVLVSVGFFFRSLSAERYAQAAADAIATGKTQLFQKSVSGALTSHQTFLAASTGSGYAAATDAEKIKIRVYLAFTRMLDVILRDDGGAADTLTELLRQYGITRTGDAFDGMKFQLPLNDDRKVILPAGAPPSAEALRNFFSGPFLTAVDASIADMDAAIALCPATEGIDREIISRTLIDAGDPTQPDVEMDAGDYYLFRAMLRFLKVYALMSAGYNANLDIRDVVALANLEMGPEMIKRLLDRYPDFLKIGDAARLNEARPTLIGAIDDYRIASEKMRNDNAVQLGAEELFSLEPDNHEEALLRENLAKMKISLLGNTTADLVTERIGTEYSVYGGSPFTTTEPSFWEKGYHPEAHGYTDLGKASDTATFSGSYNCYIITTKPGNMAPVDTVRGSDDAYLGTNITVNTNQWWNVGGAPDGAYALIGGNSGGDYYGFIVICPSAPITSLTVHLTNVANIAREEHFQLNLFPLFGDDATAPKALRDLLPQLNEFGYPVPGTMGNGLGNDPTLGGILPDFTTQEQWVREMDGVFMPTGPMTIPQVADGAIIVDGGVADWTTAGISTPVLTDVTGEKGQGTAANGDLQKLFLALDSQYLYVRMDLAGDWNLTGQNFMYALRFRQSPGDGPDKPGDVKIFARNRNGVWEVKAQSMTQGYGWSWPPTDQASGGGTAVASGKIVEWRIPRGSGAAGRFLAADTEAWYYDPNNPTGWEYWYAYDKNRTCLQIQPSAGVTGTLTVPGYDGVGPVRIGVFEYSPNFSTSGEKRLGSQGILPDGLGQLPAGYSISNLPVGKRVFVSVFWDRDGDGVVSPGDYTSFSQPFTTITGSNVQDLAVDDHHSDYQPPQFLLAKIYHEKSQSSGNWDVLLAAALTGPSPDDVAVTVTGPGVEYRLAPGAWIRNRWGLIYKANVPWLPDGDYTFTAVDSQGRRTERGFHYEARYDLPSIAALSPANRAYTGTAAPTLSWTAPTGGPYLYQLWVLDYNNNGNGVVWYVSDATSSTSLTVPAGILLPDTPYYWFVRLYEGTAQPTNFTMSPVYAFHTGTYAANPAYSMVQLGARPPTGNNVNYSWWVDAKIPGVAPWEVTGWRVKKGGAIIGSGSGGPFTTRSYDAFYEGSFATPNAPISATDYVLEMDLNRSGTVTTLTRSGIAMSYQPVQAVDVTSLSPAGNHYFNTASPSFSWERVADPNAYYRVRIYEPLGRLPVWQGNWSQTASASVPPGILKLGGTYMWTVMTTPAINPSYVSVYVNTEGNTSNRIMYRFTLQPPVRGDLSGDAVVTLEDAIIALQAVSGLTPTVTLPAETGADSRIGLPEAIYILQEVSGLR